MSSGKYFILFCLLLIFFNINFFEKLFQEYHLSVKQRWIQIRPDVLSDLIWVQIVCKSYQQTTLGDKRVKITDKNINKKTQMRDLRSPWLSCFKRYFLFKLCHVSRVPTSSRNHGKSLRKVPCMENHGI